MSERPDLVTQLANAIGTTHIGAPWQVGEYPDSLPERIYLKLGNAAAEVVSSALENLNAEIAGYVRDVQAYQAQTNLVPSARYQELAELGQHQADEFDRYWKAAGVLDAKVTVDDAIARYQALVARAEAAEARLAFVAAHYSNAIHYCCRVDGDEWNTDFYGTLDKTMARDAARKTQS